MLIPLTSLVFIRLSHNPIWQAKWFRLFRFRSPLLTESLICFLFLQVLRWFTSLGLLFSTYFIQLRVIG